MTGTFKTNQQELKKRKRCTSNAFVYSSEAFVYSSAPLEALQARRTLWEQWALHEGSLASVKGCKVFE